MFENSVKYLKSKSFTEFSKFENSVKYLKPKSFTEFSKDEKAQMHTLEGVAAATIMLLVIVYALDATSMTALSSSTANAHAETGLRLLGQDILSTLDYAEPGYNSKLKNDILTLKWNGYYYIWNGTQYLELLNLTVKMNLSDKNLTAVLNDTLVRQGIAHNVVLTFLTLSSDNSTLIAPPLNLIYAGNPSDNAVIVSRKIVLQDRDFGSPSNYPIMNTIKDIDPSTNLYNIVDVKLILWRM